LAIVVRIVAGPAITQRDVEKTVRPETHLAPVVIPVRLWHFQQDSLGREISFVRVRGRDFEFADHTAPGILLAVINVEKTVRLESGMKREAQQTLFIFHQGFPVLDIQKLLRVRAVAAFAHDNDAPTLLHDKHSVRAIRRLREPHRTIHGQSREHLTQSHLGQCRFGHRQGRSKD
jgi:hypothetical protein